MPRRFRHLARKAFPVRALLKQEGAFLFLSVAWAGQHDVLHDGTNLYGSGWGFKGQRQERPEKMSLGFRSCRPCRLLLMPFPAIVSIPVDCLLNDS